MDKHCNPEFIKHVFPKLERPTAPRRLFELITDWILAAFSSLTVIDPLLIANEDFESASVDSDAFSVLLIDLNTQLPSLFYNSTTMISSLATAISSTLPSSLILIPLISADV